MNPSRAGLQSTSELRQKIATAKQEATVAEKERKDAEYAFNSNAKAIAVLGSIPPEQSVTPEALKSYIAAQIVDEKKKPRGTSADLPGLYQLQKTIGEGLIAADILAAQLAGNREPLEAKVNETTPKAEKAKNTLAALESQYKAYTDLVPEKELQKWFEKDRTASTPRLIEQELAVLKEKLKAFPPRPPSTVAPCPAREALETFVANLEAEVDRIAHKAPCEFCNVVGGVDRTPAAKDLINAKVAELERLAKLPNDDGLTPEQKTDYALAKALESMRNARDEDGKTAGKMLGVLICKAPDDKIVYLYGYSGTLGSNSRIAEAEAIKIQRKLDIPGHIAAKKQEIETNNTAIAQAQTKLTQAESDAVGKDQKSPEAKLVGSTKAEIGALRVKGEKLKKELTALESTLPPNLDELASQLAEQRKACAAASKLDTAIENATAGSWVRALPEDGVLESLGHDSVSLAAKNKGRKETPHGVCSAPKMIQHAFGEGYQILGMAEAWYGGGTNTHGELVASCTTCMSNIGFQFCTKTKHEHHH